MSDALVRNLKLFNAKERDHLMRFAYLGRAGPYETESTFLSPDFENLLRDQHVYQMGLSRSAKCVFAGMDYHLDWIFAAISIARKSPGWTPQQPEASVPSDAMGEHEAVEGVKHMYTDFRPVTGSQEDVDLLAVYDDGEKLAVLFVEAKGSASFDRVQLARKLIRLDNILDHSGVLEDRGRVEFRLILMAPKKPKNITNCLDYAKGLPESKQFQPMHAALKKGHASGIGDCFHFLPLPGFPKELHAVERVGEDGNFNRWSLKKRP